MALLKLDPSTNKSKYSKTLEPLFLKYNSLTAKEYTELFGNLRINSEELLNDLVANGYFEKLSTKNGAIWTVKNAFADIE